MAEAVPPKPAPKRPCILCVDDEEAVRSLLAKLVKRMGYACEMVADGREALQKIGTDLDRFNLVVTDHDMPGMDGLALVQALRAANFPGRIVVHSSSLDANRRATYEFLQVDAIIEKPATIAALVGTITNLGLSVKPRSKSNALNFPVNCDPQTNK